jgi:hypothetical protein
VNNAIASDAGNGTATSPVQRRLRVLDSEMGVIHRQSHRPRQLPIRPAAYRRSQDYIVEPAARAGDANRRAAVRRPRGRRLNAASVDEELTDAARRPRDSASPPGIVRRRSLAIGVRRPH